jgi:hypothetical protein
MMHIFAQLALAQRFGGQGVWGEIEWKLLIAGASCSRFVNSFGHCQPQGRQNRCRTFLNILIDAGTND